MYTYTYTYIYIYIYIDIDTHTNSYMYTYIHTYIQIGPPGCDDDLHQDSTSHSGGRVSLAVTGTNSPKKISLVLKSLFSHNYVH